MDLIAKVDMIYIILFSAGIIIHSCGLFLLWKARKSNMDKTQRLILISLSVSALLLASDKTFMTVIALCKYNPTPLIHAANEIISELSNYSYYMLMYLLTMDRLMRIFLGFRYPIFWSVKRTSISLGFVWIVALVTTLVIFQRQKNYASFKAIQIIDVCLDGLFLLLSFTTYGIVICKLHRMTKLRTITCNIPISRIRRNIIKGFITSLSIVVTFVIFIVVPHLIATYRSFSRSYSDSEYVLLTVLRTFGFIVDPIIYIFLSPQIRAILLGKWKNASIKKKSANNANRNFSLKEKRENVETLVYTRTLLRSITEQNT